MHIGDEAKPVHVEDIFAALSLAGVAVLLDEARTKSA
jgi:hypothetical protein